MIERLLAGLRRLIGRPKIHEIGHVGVTVSDFEAAVAWYHEMFGFYLVSEMTVEGEAANALSDLYGERDLTVRLGFMRAPGGGVLEIFQFTPAAPPEPVRWNRVGYTHLALSVSNVAVLTERLKAKGVEFVLDEPQFLGGAHWIFFKDPDGNLIELIDLHANRLPLKYLGGVIGRQYRSGKYSPYYGQ